MNDAVQSNATMALGRWQFQLRGLMFLTFVAALCAAVIRISVELGIVVFPLVAAALYRTIRVAKRDTAARSQDKAAGGLFTTFCRSLGIVLSMIVVSAVTLALGCLAVTLVILELAGRACSPPITLVCRCCFRGWRFGISVWNMLRSVASRLRIRQAFGWSRASLFKATVVIGQSDRRLFQRFWLREIDGTNRHRDKSRLG